MSLTMPAFGQADLSNCEREQIHLAGSIQPHGVLLHMVEPALDIVQASANAGDMLGVGDVVGRPLEALDGDIAETIRPFLSEALDVLPVAVRCHAGSDLQAFDCLLHRPPGGGLIIELERAGPDIDLSRDVHQALQQLIVAPSLRSLADDTADRIKALTGYDRVMVYRFDEDGHGEVYAERKEPDLEAFLGNRYPASDIPHIARRLYEKNRIRVLVDVDYQAVPVLASTAPNGADAPLDMSLCSLRSMSPIHIQYLKNMGVGATLVISLMVGGKLWGLIACHHYAPRFVHYEMRAVCELLAEAIGVRIAALQSVGRNQVELSVRRLEQRMIEIISREGDWRTALFDSTNLLLDPLEAGGAALLFEGQIHTAGEVPGTEDLRRIGDWLNRQPRESVVASKSLGLDVPAFAPLKSVASGVIATPLSRCASDYLIWFRPERIRTVTWGGNPDKPVEFGNDPADLSPRRSFAQWHQQVEGTSDSWTETDRAAVRLIGDAIADVALQFRSVRMLIARTQLEQISDRVATSEQPLLIADAGGDVILTNTAFDQRIAERRSIQKLDELPALFTLNDLVDEGLTTARDRRTSWRREVRTLGGTREGRPFLMRVDPVSSTPEDVMGFVILFSDLSEQKVAESTRQHFQDDLNARHRMPSLPLDSKTGLLYRNILSSIVGNAQLAALEITESMDAMPMSVMLDSVSASVNRTTDLLEHLIGHVARGDSSDHVVGGNSDDHAASIGTDDRLH